MGVTDAELELLKILWDRGPHSPRELRDVLAARRRDRAYTTVQTLLHRLLRKGLVAREKRGANRVYRARRSRDELLADQLDELAERVCDGARTPLLLSLARAERMTPEELARLKGVLARSARRRRRRRGR